MGSWEVPRGHVGMVPSIDNVWKSINPYTHVCGEIVVNNKRHNCGSELHACSKRSTSHYTSKIQTSELENKTILWSFSTIIKIFCHSDTVSDVGSKNLTLAHVHVYR